MPISFLRESGAEFDEYIYTWAEILRNAWFRRPETWGTLTTAISSTAPEAAQIASKDLMLKVLYPPLELFHRYQRQETEQFNAALVDALTWHKEYWTANEARSLSSEGLRGANRMSCGGMSSGVVARWACHGEGAAVVGVG
ncbi:immunity 49 family protein [Streptomyces sp. x-80]|uniref:immunity 49 family protein n=1 Tax=Streptomyces sp. x-80 TaxID=2789282 RepID=UPI003980EFB8